MEIYGIGLMKSFIKIYAVPALRGKDYGKTKMRYPDYLETESGLQYKVNFIVILFIFP